MPDFNNKHNAHLINQTQKNDRYTGLFGFDIKMDCWNTSNNAILNYSFASWDRSHKVTVKFGWRCSGIIDYLDYLEHEPSMMLKPYAGCSNARFIWTDPYVCNAYDMVDCKLHNRNDKLSIKMDFRICGFLLSPNKPSFSRIFYWCFSSSLKSPKCLTSCLFLFSSRKLFFAKLDLRRALTINQVFLTANHYRDMISQSFFSLQTIIEISYRNLEFIHNYL